MKKFFSEFKTFITRGNVVDMAVGVIVGGAFTAIVNGLSNFILKPLTNYLLALLIGKDSLTELYTMLLPVYTDVVDEATGVTTTTLDLTQSIYIDWGSFINAIINFLLIALVLFCIVRFINKVRANQDKQNKKYAKYKFSKEEKKAMKAQGIKLSDKAAVDAYIAEKERAAAEAKAAEEAAAAEAARLERLANPTTEDILKEIRDLLKKA